MDPCTLQHGKRSKTALTISVVQCSLVKSDAEPIATSSKAIWGSIAVCFLILYIIFSPLVVVSLHFSLVGYSAVFVMDSTRRDPPDAAAAAAAAAAADSELAEQFSLMEAPSSTTSSSRHSLGGESLVTRSTENGASPLHSEPSRSNVHTVEVAVM